MSKKETLAEAGFSYVHYAPELSGHILRHIASGEYELWFATTNHASGSLIYENTRLEFARTLKR